MSNPIVADDVVTGTTSTGVVTAQVAAPSGYVVTGGGSDCQSNDPHSFFLQDSYPLLDNGVPRGWKVQYRYTGSLPTSYDIAVFAICVEEA